MDRTKNRLRAPARGEETGAARRTPKRSCLQSCVAILEYADNTEKQLFKKLEGRGYRPAEIMAAVARVKEKGLFDESAYALRFLRSCARRGYGPRRIAMEMRRKGFSKENLAMAEEILRGDTPSFGGDPRGRDNSDIENLLSSLDFPRDCAILICKTVQGRGFSLLREVLQSGELPQDREDRAAVYAQRQKLRAAMLRRGYTFAQVKDAEVEAGRVLASEDAGDD